MNTAHDQSGFSLIELLVATAIFMFVVTGVSGLFIQAVDLQRRAAALQKIEENSQFVLESIAREVRVSTITSGDTNCAPPDPVTTHTLALNHPVNGAVTYTYDRSSDVGIVSRNGQPITSGDVDISAFAFCVSGSTTDQQQTRVTIPMTLQVVGNRAASSAPVSLQTTIVSRDLLTDLAQ